MKNLGWGCVSGQPQDLAQEPLVKGLYDIMSEYWVPTKIGKSTEEVEQTEVNGNKESVEVAKQHTDQQCLEDGYGFVHGSMASLLEAPTDGTPQARMVEPLTDSQIPVGYYVEGNEAAANGDTKQIDEAASQKPCQTVAPETCIEVEESAVPSTADEKDSPSLTPTEMEVTPDSAKVAEPPAVSMAVTIRDPMPSAGKYTPEDVAFLDARIQELKQLN